MPLSRRQFLWTTAASAGALSAPWGMSAATHAQGAARRFAHGVASGDPLTDRVVLWTRVTPPEGTTRVDKIEWRIAADAALTRVVARGTASTSTDRDFTVKIDATGLQPRRT